MKKTTLLVAMFCISALNCMEPEQPMSSETSSSEESSVYHYIKSLIKLYNNVDTAISAIKVDSQTNRDLNMILNDESQQEKFTELVHDLAKAFNRPSYVVAAKIGTPAAQEYQALGEALLFQVKKGDIEQVASLMRKDADINFSSREFFREINAPDGEIEIQYDETSPLTYAVIFGRSKIVKLLLDAGVKSESDDYYESHGYYPPEFKTPFGVTGTKEDRKEIERLINGQKGKG